MFTHISKVFVIMSFSVFFGLVKNIFLAKELTKTDMGIFTLIMTIVGFIYPIALFGQQNSFIRAFSKKNLDEYSWKKTFRYILLISCLLSFVGLIVAFAIYKNELDFYLIVFGFIAILSTVVVELLTSVSRAKGDFVKSALLSRSIRFLFPFVLVGAYLWQRFDLETILAAFGILYFFHALVTGFVINKSYTSGSKAFSRSFFLDGLLFLGSDLSLLVIISMDKFFLAKMMSMNDLAVYFSIFAITRLYDLALQATEFVLMPYSNQMAKLRLGRILIFVVTLAAAISVFYLLFGEMLLNVIYGTKYAEGISLIPWFCAVGVIRMLYCVPASIIGGRLRQKTLRYLLVSNSSLILVNIILVIIFISNFGLIGAVAATLAVWILRNIGAYTLLLRFKS